MGIGFLPSSSGVRIRPKGALHSQVKIIKIFLGAGSVFKRRVSREYFVVQITIGLSTGMLVIWNRESVSYPGITMLCTEIVSSTSRKFSSRLDDLVHLVDLNFGTIIRILLSCWAEKLIRSTNKFVSFSILHWIHRYENTIRQGFVVVWVQLIWKYTYSTYVYILASKQLEHRAVNDN